MFSNILTMSDPDIETSDPPLKLLQKGFLLSVDCQSCPVVILRADVVPGKKFKEQTFKVI
jgi:hypothetical protein